MNKKSLLITLPMMIALALTGCGSTDVGTKEIQNAETSQSATPTTAPVTPDTSQSANQVAPVTEVPSSGSAVEALNKLVVADEADSDAYERDLFNHWVSKNSTGCDTRVAVLVEESLTKATLSGCTVTSGEWKSVYDGKTVTDPKTLDIDHMIPLKEAWESGASKWDSTAREAFANDMAYSESLVAVTAASNRSKSDRDPAGYLPTDNSYRCSYVSKWITVKTKWKMTVDAQEKSAIQTVLNTCGNDTSVSNVEAAPANETPVAPVAEAPVAAPVAPVAPVAGTDGNDPKFASCKAATAGGYGPYTKGEPEYEFYRDGDNDGTVCEK